MSMVRSIVRQAGWSSLIGTVMCSGCPAEGNVQKQVSSPSRHELVQQLAPRYHEASRGQKTFVLNAFVAVTGYSRRYAM
jgi:hypothetical protein